MLNPAISYTKHELADLVWLLTGRVPHTIRTQGLLVIAEFGGTGDSSIGVWRIEDLERS